MLASWFALLGAGQFGLHFWMPGWEESDVSGAVIVLLAGLVLFEFSRRRIEWHTGDDRPLLLHLISSLWFAVPAAGFALFWQVTGF